MKEPVKFTYEGPGYIIVAGLITLLIIGGFSVDPLLALFGRIG